MKIDECAPYMHSAGRVSNLFHLLYALGISSAKFKGFKYYCMYVKRVKG